MEDLIYDQEEKIAWLAQMNVRELSAWIEDFLRRGITGRLSIHRHERRNLILVHYFNTTENAVFRNKFREAITKLLNEITLIDHNLSFYNDVITIAGLARCIEAKDRLDQIAFGGRLKQKICGVEELHEKTLAVLFGFRRKTLHAGAIINRDIEFPEYCQLCFRGCLDLLGIDCALGYIPKLLTTYTRNRDYPISPTLEILVDHMGLANFVEKFLNICSRLDGFKQEAFIENLIRAGMNIRFKEQIEEEPDKAYFEFIWKKKTECLLENRGETLGEEDHEGVLKGRAIETIGEMRRPDRTEIDELAEEVMMIDGQ